MIEGARTPLKRWQQAAVAVGSAVGALLNPRRADLIAALGETTGKPSFERVLERMKRSPEGRAVLLERPRVISTKVGHAWDLPPNTFGAAYANFMGSRNFSPDDRPPVRFMDTDELAYVAMRAREVHDFWHTLFDLPTNLIGESALKVIEFEQMYLPMCMLSVVGGTARFNEKQRKLFFQHYFPWAVQAGLQCTDLMCIYYEQHFHEDLEDVRRKWGYFLLLFLLHKTLSEQQQLPLVWWIVTSLDFEFYRCGIQLVPTETYAETHHEANIQSLFFL